MINEIMQRAYNSSELSVKGYSLILKDAFFVTHSTHAYVVFIAEKSNLDGSNQSFSYVLYSVDKESVIASSSDLYKAITSPFPSLTDLSNAGGKADFVRKRTLSKQLDILTESYVKHSGLLGDDKDAYISYLTEMEEIKAPSFKPIYEYFLEGTRR